MWIPPTVAAATSATAGAGAGLAAAAHLHRSTTAASAWCAGPPGTDASRASTRSSRALLLATAPFSPTISSLTATATSSRVTTAPSPPLTRSATPTWSDASLTAFILCSANSGHASTGTPAHTASRHEFHPQCERNPPTARCSKISTCGAHCGTTSPTPFVLSTNPSGRQLTGSSVVWWPK
nr:unnamed protein product [Digitaria exilis]